LDAAASTCSVGIHRQDRLNWSLSEDVLFRMFLPWTRVGCVLTIRNIKNINTKAARDRILWAWLSHASIE
jgi:hypothetical protein